MLEELNVLANFEDSDFDPILLDQNDQKEEEEKDEENLDEIDSRSEVNNHRNQNDTGNDTLIELNRINHNSFDRNQSIKSIDSSSESFSSLSTNNQSTIHSIDGFMIRNDSDLNDQNHHSQSIPSVTSLSRTGNVATNKSRIDSNFFDLIFFICSLLDFFIIQPMNYFTSDENISSLPFYFSLS